MANYEVIQLEARRQVRFYTSIDPGSFVAPHWHDSVEIIYLQEGSLLVTLDNGEVNMHAGSCIVINANFVHSTTCSELNRAIVFQIPLSLLQRYVPDSEDVLFRLNTEQTGSDKDAERISSFISLLEQMQQVEDEKPEAGELLFNSLLYQAVYRLYRDFGYRIHNNKAGKHVRDMEKLLPLLQFVNEHYTEKISIEKAASLMALEPRYFCRFFKKNMGVTFLEYQNEIRLARIYRDLVDTNLEIQHILDRHGFYNYKVFRRLFTDRFHMTPVQLRKAYSHSLQDQLLWNKSREENSGRT